jgi:membrane-associated phospholipid phosphatase
MTPRRLVALGLASTALAFASPAVGADPQKVEWSEDWRRASLWEGVAALALSVADTEIDQRIPYPTTATWHGGILFDDWARQTFRGRTATAQSTASTLTDWFYKAGSLVPPVIDAYFAALSIHENADVAIQMAIIELEAYSVSALISLGAEHAVGRARPFTEDCGATNSAGQLLHQCGTSDDARSFYSGHAAATATTAGLVCIEHQHLPLFGGGVADLVPCVLMSAVSVASGLLRLTVDEHWASDVIVGWMAGAASGYLLPALMHYGFGNRPPGEVVSGSLRAIPTLMPYPGGMGAGMVGAF